jgi:hypothetical protein
MRKQKILVSPKPVSPEVVAGAKRKLHALLTILQGPEKNLQRPNGAAAFFQCLLTQADGDQNFALCLVRKALKRIKEGSFGVCDCSRSIPTSMILNRPWDPYCGAACRRR